jgi:hypothetical protein
MLKEILISTMGKKLILVKQFINQKKMLLVYLRHHHVIGSVG